MKCTRHSREALVTPGTGGVRNSRMLAISRSDLDVIIDHCLSGLPDEACGILGGNEGTVKKVYRMRNVRPSPVSYEMDAEEQFRVLKDIRREGHTLMGIFHSHPRSPAYPSSVDVEKAYWPGTVFPNYPEAVYLIVSLLEQQPDIRVFSILEGSVRELQLVIVRSRRP